LEAKRLEAYMTESVLSNVENFYRGSRQNLYLATPKTFTEAVARICT